VTPPASHIRMAVGGLYWSTEWWSKGIRRDGKRAVERTPSRVRTSGRYRLTLHPLPHSRLDPIDARTTLLASILPHPVESCGTSCVLACSSAGVSGIKAPRPILGPSRRPFFNGPIYVLWGTEVLDALPASLHGVPFRCRKRRLEPRPECDPRVENEEESASCLTLTRASYMAEFPIGSKGFNPLEFCQCVESRVG
jgi:hypothetical protein